MSGIKKKLLLFFYKPQENILSAALFIMFSVLVSRILGLLRDRMLTARFATEELGVYFAAFRIPNLLFELLVMGALSTAFIPVFTSYLSQSGEKEAFRIASSVINIGIVIFSLLLIPLYLFINPIANFLTPGFTREQVNLMIEFTKLILAFQVLPLLIGNFLTGILQSYKQFIVAAFAPVIYNIGIIFGIFFLSAKFGLYAPVYGVIIGALLFVFIQIPPILNLKYRHSVVFDFRHKGVREIGRLMLPRTLGLAVSQIDTTVDLILASYLGSKSVAIFNFAQHLQQLPIGLFGATIAQAALPAMSQFTAKKTINDFKKIFLSSFHQILFLVIPSSVFLIVLRVPVVRLVFGASRFDWESTVLTGKTLAFFSLSLFAQSLLHLVIRSFYALHDTKTPVMIGVVSVVINTILSILFINFFLLPVWSLGLSASIASIFNLLVLFVIFNRNLGYFEFKQFFVPILKIFLASFIMGVFLYVPMKLLDQLVFDTTRVINLLFLTTTAAFSGLSVYIFLSWFFNLKEVFIFFNLLNKFGRLRRISFETSREIVNGSEDKL